MDAKLRLALVDDLHDLGEAELTALISFLSPPSSVMPSRQAVGADRVAALLDWAEGPGGCGLAEVAQMLTRVCGNSSVEPKKRLGNLPPSCHFFIGREDVLGSIQDTLQPNGVGALTQAISGLGGIGKTQTAIQYAYRCTSLQAAFPDYPRYTAVLWVNAANQHLLRNDFMKIAVTLGVPLRNQQGRKKQKAIIQEVIQWLQDPVNQTWLLILDNVDKVLDVEEFFKEFQFHRPQGHILYTSRLSDLRLLGVAKPIEMDVMMEDEAIRFLKKSTGRENVGEKETKAASKLAEELGYLPLALELAAAYISAKKQTFQTYLANYLKKPHQQFASQLPPRDYQFTVETVWSLNFGEIEQHHRSSAELLYFISFVAPDDIPQELAVAAFPSQFVSIEDRDEKMSVYDDLLEPLTRYSLIKKDISNNTLGIHRLVQAVVRNKLEPEAQVEWQNRAVKAVNDLFPSTHRPDDDLCNRLLSHAMVCWEHISSLPAPEAAAYELLIKLGHYIRRTQADYSTVEEMLTKAMDIEESMPTPYVARSLQQLASLRENQGRLSEALGLVQRVREIRETVLGPKHLDTGEIQGFLARLLYRYGQYHESEELYLKVIGTFRALGASSGLIAWYIHGLGELYFKQGQHAKRRNNHGDARVFFCQAMHSFREALELRSTLDLAESNIAWSYLGLGSLHRELGNYDRAREYLRDALKIWKRYRDPDHPHRAVGHMGMGLLYRDLGNSEKAEQQLIKSLDICDRNPDRASHPDTAEVVGYLADLYKNHGRYDEAIHLYERTLTIYSSMLPPDHPSITLARADYDELLQTRK